MTYLLIGIDPSLSCTGVAALKWDGAGVEKLLRFGTVKADTSLGKAGPIERALDIATGVVSAIYEETITRTYPGPKLLVAIEAPQDRMFRSEKRSNANLPGYGVCVGAVAQRVAMAIPEARTYYPTPMEWGSRYPTSGDTHKTGRVRLVESMYRLRTGALGPKSTAGNVADAVLLARYARQKFELEQKYGRTAR